MYCSRFIAIVTVLLIYLLPGKLDAVTNEDAEPSWRPSPTGAALRSLAFPGWGQMYAGSPLKAVIYASLEQGFIYGIYRQDKLYRFYSARGEDSIADVYLNDRNRLGWYLTATLILSVMDAYVEAHLYGFDVSDDLAGSSERHDSVRSVNCGLSGLPGGGVVLNIFWRIP
ncbi:hypothetical protein HQ587_07295 [bacterium]|nr:hypothetical protein [bacterium]